MGGTPGTRHIADHFRERIMQLVDLLSADPPTYTTSLYYGKPGSSHHYSSRLIAGKCFEAR